MSSKQLNFFITPEDYDLINIFLQKYQSIILSNNHIGEIETFSLTDLGEENKQFFVTKKDFLSDIIIKKEENINYYYITSSFLLEFSLGGFYLYDRNSLQRARFYYIKGYYDDSSNFVYKSEEFLNWCDEILKNFKKTFLKKYSRDKNCYYSESAIKWIELNSAILNNGGQQWSKNIG